MMKISTTAKKPFILPAVITSLWLLIFYLRQQALSCPCKSAGEDKHTYNNEGKEQHGLWAKPIVLLWFWPLGQRFHLGSCLDRFHMDGCVLTDNRSRDADIIVRNKLTIRSPQMNTDDRFVLTKKDKLVCWIVSNNNPRTGTAKRATYYQQLLKNIKIHVFGAAFTGQILPYEDYYPTIAGCKFYLSFENSIHKDYITEKVNGPLVTGAVPVVLGPPRENYEQFLLAKSFIHVDDFKDPKSLAYFLLHLDQSPAEYMRYFEWREFYIATPHLLSIKMSSFNPFVRPVNTCAGTRATGSNMTFINGTLHEGSIS